jgi:Holliday junction DNA helicase RuvA
LIGRLHGLIIDSEGDGTVILDVRGVGYELVTPLGSVGRITPDDEGRVMLHVHTHVREDALVLFGFATADDRETFRTLIGISKVGPKLALAVLGFVTVNELAHLVETGQPARLQKVPGVGKKTAERMVLELKGKLAPTATQPATRTPHNAGEPPQSDQAGILAAALVRMGFKQTEAERAVQSIEALDRPMSELIREALSVLSP